MRRKYLDALAVQLGIKHPEDWYSITTGDVQRYGDFLTEYKGSLASALQVAFPEYSWLSWRFERIAPIFWESFENQVNL